MRCVQRPLRPRPRYPFVARACRRPKAELRPPIGDRNAAYHGDDIADPARGHEWRDRAGPGERGALAQAVQDKQTGDHRTHPRDQRFCRKFQFSGQNPKIEYQRFDSLQSSKTHEKVNLRQNPNYCLVPMESGSRIP